MSREDDDNLLRACRPQGLGTQPSEAGFKLLYAAYGSRVRTVIFRFGDAGDLADLVQESFLKIWQGLPNFQGDCALSTWIYRVAVNVAKDHYRFRRRRWWLSLMPEGEAMEQSADPTNAVATWQLKEDLSQAVEQLSPKLKEVVILFSTQELDIEQIATILNIPSGTVKSRLHQARQKLRTLVENPREAYG